MTPRPTSTICIEHDDTTPEVIDKVNLALAPFRLALIDDDQPHDGFMILKLKEVSEPAS